jgi:hypothetical protein
VLFLSLLRCVLFVDIQAKTMYESFIYGTEVFILSGLLMLRATHTGIGTGQSIQTPPARAGHYKR